MGTESLTSFKNMGYPDSVLVDNKWSLEGEVGSITVIPNVQRINGF